jgi:hypothetical protein
MLVSTDNEVGYPVAMRRRPSCIGRRGIAPTMLIECILLSASLCRAIHDKPVLALGMAQSAALVADGVTTTERVRQGYTETDSVTKLFLGSRPKWAGMAPLGAAQCLLETWLAERMRSSSHKWIRRFWWVPQSVGIGGNTWGAQANAREVTAQSGP